MIGLAGGCSGRETQRPPSWVPPPEMCCFIRRSTLQRCYRRRRCDRRCTPSATCAEGRRPIHLKPSSACVRPVTRARHARARLRGTRLATYLPIYTDNLPNESLMRLCPWVGRLGLAVLHERTKPTSDWEPYIQNLPNCFPGMPLFFNGTEVAALQDAAIMQEVNER